MNETAGQPLSGGEGKTKLPVIQTTKSAQNARVHSVYDKPEVNICQNY